MKQRLLLSLICATTIFLAVPTSFNNLSPTNNHGLVEASTVNGTRKITQGELQALGRDGRPRAECPLKRTDVKADVSGSLARVTVTQDFHNPFKEKIEAVYVFPLPQSAAVDDMTMIVGDRTVKGKIKRREEARAIYEAAREAGQAASLLDQERPNIFTQSVANIAPGAEVKITISYVEFLRYEDGTYEFVFPMVVGPRYIPGRPIGRQGGGWSLDTSKVPDASRITPRVAPKGARAGHDISIEVKLDTGVPIDNLKSTLHEVDVARRDNRRAVVRLKNQTTIPNKDFVLKFDVAVEKISDAVMTHRGARGGFFTLMFQPPERVTAVDVAPKELVFVLDTSGSMSGFPIEKAKETMKLALDNLHPDDTFNLITFSGDTHVLFPQPVPATRENLHRAQVFLASRQGSGGTEMMKAIRAALVPSDKQNHVRIVCFMTDGYVGNDMEIISEVQKRPNARVFAFGIGSSVNRFLLDKIAEHGRGEVEYVSLQDDGSAAARRFHERVRNPLLTDIEIDWAGLPVADVYPKRLPDLFSVKPLILTGRYTGAARGVIRLSGALAVMSIWIIVIMVERYLTFSAARNQSREFYPKVAASLKSQKIDEAISLSDKYKKSHLAMVVNTGLQEFRAHQLSSDINGEVIAASMRALQRTTAIKIAEFRRGLLGLSTIGSTALFVGLFGTLFGIIDALQGIGDSASAGIPAVAGVIAEALVPTAVGLAVAVPAVWLFKYFTCKVDKFVVEMDNSSAELIDFFLKQRGKK
jgi:biopolymer transport protein ExbB/TolQ/uncharacterized protein YegL